ncbi:MAG: hypothetical protein Q4B52_07990 [Tissierellia bacterium]|nr:hypothetical protein [Tissierellia bacterium]
MKTKEEKEITKKAKEFQKKYMIPAIVSFFTSALFTIILLIVIECHR